MSTNLPRTAEFLVVKRNGLQLGRAYGHWWVELDGVESYGWWPARGPLRFRAALRGVPGVLNGVGVHEGATPQRDPYHGTLADHAFHPVLVELASDDDVRERIRAYAASYEGAWRWSTRPTPNCRTFQLGMLDAAGLVDGTGSFHTRGDGCPFAATWRRISHRIDGRRRWPRNLPAPSQSPGEGKPTTEERQSVLASRASFIGTGSR